MARTHTLLILSFCLVAASGASAADAPRGASSCIGCHASRAGIEDALPSLKGRKASEIAEPMLSFKEDRKPATVMNRIAKGFSDAEITAIADWFAEQQP
ncbi:MAG: c-type cytochrome [Pseudolabrys sp.]